MEGSTERPYSCDLCGCTFKEVLHGYSDAISFSQEKCWILIYFFYRQLIVKEYRLLLEKGLRIFALKLIIIIIFMRIKNNWIIDCDHLI